MLPLDHWDLQADFEWILSEYINVMDVTVCCNKTANIDFFNTATTWTSLCTVVGTLNEFLRTLFIANYYNFVDDAVQIIWDCQSWISDVPSHSAVHCHSWLCSRSFVFELAGFLKYWTSVSFFSWKHIASDYNIGIFVVLLSFIILHILATLLTYLGYSCGFTHRLQHDTRFPVSYTHLTLPTNREV